MTRLLFAGFTLLIVCVPDTVTAQTDPPPTRFSGSVTLTSNYIGRGLAQSVGQPSLLAELDYDPVEGWYGGLSGASINWIDQLYPGNSVSLELDGWVGYRVLLGENWTIKGGVLRLQFPGRYVPQTPPVARPDTTEVFGSLGWRNLSARLNYSVTDAFGTPDSRGSWYLDLSATLPLSDAWSADFHLGRKQARGHDPVTGIAHDRTSYTDYKAALTYAFGQGSSITLAYTGTNADPLLYTLNDYNVSGEYFWVRLQQDF